MKTAISIPAEVFREAEALAKHRGVSRSALYVAAMREYLAEQAQDEVTAALDAVYAQHESGLDSRDLEMQAASLPAEDW
jgi:metal-responsive CopG/Arc/MetJ family transcriptional regulator